MGEEERRPGASSPLRRNGPDQKNGMMAVVVRPWVKGRRIQPASCELEGGGIQPFGGEAEEGFGLGRPFGLFPSCGRVFGSAEVVNFVPGGWGVEE